MDEGKGISYKGFEPACTSDRSLLPLLPPLLLGMLGVSPRRLRFRMDAMEDANVDEDDPNREPEVPMLRRSLRKILGQAARRADFFAGLPFADVEEITVNLCVKREFAQTSYGRVYRGWTKDRQEVAVADMAELDFDRFLQELDKASTFDHRNLARVFDLPNPNGRLRCHLSDESYGLGRRTLNLIIKCVHNAVGYIHVGYIHVGLEKRPLPTAIVKASNKGIVIEMEIRRDRRSNRRMKGSSSKQNTSLLRMDGEYNRELKVLEHTVHRKEPPNNISLMLLQLITKDFSEELIIGRGGCGVVYKGILANGIIAVKKLFNSHTIDDKMFHQEVKSMMMVNHQNTVRFVGYCSHTEEKAMKLEGRVILAQIRERLLCFEYIGNGNLASHLTDELRGLEWHTRYKIIQGICEGLQHLHKEKHIVHMDLKPSNILLDDDMVPKITDFGLSRHDDKSQTMSAIRLLSLGYCAPEYLHCGKRSPKSDIYSLGVIIKELVTGSKRNPCTTEVHRRWKHRWNRSAKDTPLLLGWYRQVAKCLDLAQRCIQMNPVDRPNIWDIVAELNKMGSSEVGISDPTEYLELKDMLGIEPLEVHLPFELNKQMSCSIELTNDMDDYFAFRITMASLRPYDIDANKGILPPRSKCRVTMTLQAQEKALPHSQSRDEFSVQSTRVDGSLTATDITGDLFCKHPGKVVDDVNLVVVLDAPTLPGDWSLRHT